MKNDSSRFGHIIQLFTVLLTAILISLFFAALVLVGKIQGTARVVNYAGLVRGKTQRIVKLEISGTPEDDLLGDVASYIEGLRFGSSELDLVRLDDADFQAKMTALSSEFDDLRNELILVRQRGYTETAIIAKSEHFFQTCDEATNLAEVYSQKRATALDFLEKVVLADIVGLLLLFGYQIFKALRYAAMNRILQCKVYLDEATGLPNKNKCEELLDAPDPPDGNTALCVFDLNNLRWNKIIICTDGDVDGFQIRTLVLTMLYRLTPTLIQEGYVYIAESPLYEITCKEKTWFAYSDKEKNDICAQLEGEKKKYDIQRSKGLGENEPDMMWLTTMNPETRRLIKVMPEDVERTAQVFDLLLGDDLAGRKEHIADNGYKYLDLADIS